ncbi:Platelet-activating factor acetylhydrolase IB subunit beta [Cricetulus griseus]|uniref:Platelet-activating factor acetylhydrolase IB subunit beta n=1 Tax=Cricetulus griseus TaxID=10029 RepID=G3I0Q4_CRIGR|nr:Platelet-activating factor acetylhydrolase IB subunit beta [Cricetulus griseus]
MNLKLCQHALVGTNSHENTAEEIAGGIEAIVQLINTRQPQAKIIVLGLLPRGEKPNPLRQKNAKANQLLKVSLPKLGNVQLLYTDGGFVHSNGAISCPDMFDFLHLTGGAYAKICKPLHELIMQLLEETPEEKQTTIA